jgi:hypothetical protein
MSEPAPPWDELTAVERAGAGGIFRFVVPEGWQQGRGAFGGLVVAALVRALEAFEASPDRPLRTLGAELCGPAVPGPSEIHVEPIRRGSGVTTLAARLLQGEEIVAHATALLARSRGEHRTVLAIEPPAPPPWREVPPLEHVAGPFTPAFARHFEFRPTGPLPFAGVPDAVVSGWIRPRARGAARDAAYIAGCVDAWWVAAIAHDARPRPMATLGFTMDLAGDLAGLDPDAPLFTRGRALAGRDGYVVETRELWGEDGRLVALNRQTVAIIR